MLWKLKEPPTSTSTNHHQLHLNCHPYQYFHHLACMRAILISATQTGDTIPPIRMEKTWPSGHPQTPSHSSTTQRTLTVSQLGRWNSGSNPDLAFAKVNPRQSISDRKVCNRFPKSQHQASIIYPTSLLLPTPNKPVRRWNFRKAQWKQICETTNLLPRTLPCPDHKYSNTAYLAFCKMLIHAAKKAIPRSHRKNYIPCWDKECVKLYDRLEHSITAEDTKTAADALLDHLGQKRKARWIETVESVDFTHSGRQAWQTINSLTGQVEQLPVSAPSQPTRLPLSCLRTVDINIVINFPEETD